MTKDFDPSPWFPETDPVRLAVLGKALEEIFELLPLLMVSPLRELPKHTQHLAEELADVEATILLIAAHFKLNISEGATTGIVYTESLSSRSAVFQDLGKAIARVIIQGIDELEPRTGESNRLILERHVGQALRTVIRLTTGNYGIDRAFVSERSAKKRAYLAIWHANMQAAIDAEKQERELDAWGDAFDRGD